MPHVPLTHDEEDLEHPSLLPPNTGSLGQPPADYEKQRVAELAQHAPVARAMAGHGRLPTDLEIKLAVVPVVREAMAGIREVLDEQAAAMKLLDIPLEQVANAHERASSSFENLRSEISDVSRRLGAVEGVIDTAGLMKAHGESAKLLATIANEVKEQLALTRTTLAEVVKALAKINADAIESTRRAQERAAQTPREVVVIGSEGRDLSTLTAEEKRKLRKALKPRKRK